MILRTIRCDVCDAVFTERQPGDGFPQWGALQGIALDGVADPNLCPGCLATLADVAERLKERRESV